VTKLRVVLVSGLSGAGKASILRALEDLGYEAVDNPPLDMVPDVVTHSKRPLAIGLDARSRGFDPALVLSTLATLALNPALLPELVYAWADETVLLRRYTETRRRHPLAPQGRVVDGIAEEAALTQPLRDGADLVIDTSDLPLAELRKIIEARFRPNLSAGAKQPGLVVSLVSFAFPAGLPREADMVFDARFLRNPHYDPILRPRTGQDCKVAAYIEADADFAPFIDAIKALLILVLPRFVHEGKKYATIAVGCTGGRHRSVHIVELLAQNLPTLFGSGAERREWQVTVTHRELERERAAQSPKMANTLNGGLGHHDQPETPQAPLSREL
jgi:UPF0042 nucleotide-binding protein